ncbi:MAG: domain S-box protein [Cypionkella sp.]|uniref:PAS domain S-box protein n=1 Tax=Cypionkella sp. TaxID=2811411 RepID=UPI0026098B9B|nr:PAS domain S-box protein [Cypionkella sp.]MDB5661656.1 domain S-box protein [Cypionkella sp.]
MTNEMSNELERERLAAIVSSSDDAIISKSLTGIISSWNRGAEKIFGYTAEEMIGQPIIRIIPPELHSQEEDILRRVKAGERIDHFDNVRLAKDGTRVDISLTVSPLRTSNGQIVGASKVARNIGERKRADELQRLLIDELNHRVKNTLAVVQSIASQSLRNNPDPRAFVSAFNGRLQALAKAHDLLIEEKLLGVNLRELIQQQIVLGSTELGRVMLRGPELVIGGSMGTHLALIIHELATNARKYGSLSNATGTLLIEWTLQEDEGAVWRLSINWQEEGAPIAPSTLIEGFGSLLLRRVATAGQGHADIQQREYGRTVSFDLLLDRHRLLTPPVAADVQAIQAKPAAGRFSLVGRRVLIVEDEFLVAMDIEGTLMDAGCTVVGPAYSVAQALVVLSAEETVDIAIIDANLQGQSVTPILRELAKQNVPFVFATGYGREALPAEWQTSPLIAKPFTPSQLIETLDRLLNGKADANL